jgi:hypothetical protein
VLLVVTATSAIHPVLFADGAASTSALLLTATHFTHALVLRACVLQVVTAKSSEVNLLVLAANPDAEDVAEHAVPEQFISTFVNGKLVTTAASRGGG